MTDNQTRDTQMQQQAFEVLYDMQVEGKPAPDNFEELVEENPYLRFVVAADTARDTLAEIGRTVEDVESVERQVLVVAGYLKDLIHMVNTIARAVDAGKDGGIDRSVIEACDMFDAPDAEDADSGEAIPKDVLAAVITLADYLAGEDE